MNPTSLLSISAKNIAKSLSDEAVARYHGKGAAFRIGLREPRGGPNTGARWIVGHLGLEMDSISDPTR